MTSRGRMCVSACLKWSSREQLTIATAAAGSELSSGKAGTPQW